jgi:hypothetical protein
LMRGLRLNNGQLGSYPRELVARGGFEPPTFGLCDLTHLSVRVGLYLHPEGCSPSSLYAFPHNSGGLVRYCLIARAT